MTNYATTPQPVINYGYGRALELPFAQAVARAEEALRAEGFGVLCQINLQEKFRETLGVDFRNYVILGACNPPLAYQALQEDIDLGLLLPCNVTVFEDDGRTIVAAIDAEKMLAVTGNDKLMEAAQQVNEKLRRVIDAL